MTQSDYGPRQAEVRVDAARYRDYSDSLAAAQDDVRECYGLDGYDLDPRWDDDELRECIVLTVPEWAAEFGYEADAR